MTDFRLAGIDLPRIGLGTNRLTTASRHVTFVREAVAAGVRHIDTAHLYGGGDSERALGDALDGTSADVLIATKGSYGGAGQGRPEVLRAQIERSLQSLRTEAIGLYYLHRMDPETPLEESLGAIKAYVDRGAIRHVGVSEVSVRADRAGPSGRSDRRRAEPLQPGRPQARRRSSTSGSAKGSRSCRTTR